MKNLQKLQSLNYKTSLNSEIVKKRFRINDFDSIYNFRELLFYNTYFPDLLYYCDYSNKFLTLYFKNLGSNLYNINDFDYIQCIDKGLYLLLELQNNKIIHGDIKPTNIIINSNINMYFIDYESFLLHTTFNKGYKIFTPNFLAPEVNNNIIDYKNDLYSFGKSILCKLYKKYNTNDLHKLESLIEYKYYNILKDCTELDYNKRKSVLEIIQLYEIQKNNININLNTHNFINITIQIQFTQIINIVEVLYKICINLNKIHLFNYTILVFYYFINFKDHSKNTLEYLNYSLAILFYSSLIIDNYELQISDLQKILNLSELDINNIYNCICLVLKSLNYKIFNLCKLESMYTYFKNCDIQFLTYNEFVDYLKN